jgi:hypothetical protein
MQKKPEAWSKFVYIMRVYNFAGILLKERVAEADLIFKLNPPMGVISVWEQFEPTVQYTRERRSNPSHMEPFEFLYKPPKTLPLFPTLIHLRFNTIENCNVAE